jgi:hypothetical protein
MPDAAEEFDSATERVLAEFATKGFGTEPLSFKQGMELRAYAKARTNLHSDNLTVEQAIWKSLYEGLTEELRKSSPESMAQIEALEERRDNVEALQQMMAAKRNAHPHDFGIRVWWGFVIIGLLVGWMRSSDLRAIPLYGLAFWIAGMFFSIFALDSAEVQSKIAIFLYHSLRERHISEWLYHRALTIR